MLIEAFEIFVLNVQLKATYSRYQNSELPKTYYELQSTTHNRNLAQKLIVSI